MSADIPYVSEVIDCTQIAEEDLLALSIRYS